MVDELIHGPEGDVRVLADLVQQPADGLILRTGDGRIQLDGVGVHDDTADCIVVAP